MSQMTMGRSGRVGENCCRSKLAVCSCDPRRTEGRGVRVMDDQLNVPLEDSELLAEVELTTNLIIAASESESPLPQDEVDRLLGLVGDCQPIPTQQIRSR